MTALTVFRLAHDVPVESPAGLDELVVQDLLDNSDTHDSVDTGFIARLYVPRAFPTRPKWVSFVQEGFPEVSIDPSEMRKALLLAAVQRDEGQVVFALPFGHTRFSIEQDRIEAAFGRRTALNIIYESRGEDDRSGDDRIRQVDARTIEFNVRRARVQRSRDTTFETFGVDPDRDLLDRIAGVPRDRDRFGSRVTGGRSIHLDVPSRFVDLPDLLWDINLAHNRTTYQEFFSWVDKVTAVKDPQRRDLLKVHVVDLMRSDPENLHLAPPEVIDWDRTATFTYELGDRSEHTDLALEDYLDAVAASRTREVTPDNLTTHRVTVRDGDGTVIDRWSVYRCLSTSFEHDGTHYVLDEGNFFAVAADYLEELKDDIRQLPAPKIALPGSTAEEHEGAYNERLAASSEQHLLLDKKLAQPVKRTTGIEICDVMTSTGELVHVKRKLGSSNLSHLFAQGFISAESLNAGPGLRTAIRSSIDEQAQLRGRYAPDFTRYADEPFSAPGVTVVYAVVANWEGQAPEERMPFFSLVNLRHYRRLIRSMGFQVAFAAVEAPPSAQASR